MRIYGSAKLTLFVLFIIARIDRLFGADYIVAEREPLAFSCLHFKVCWRFHTITLSPSLFPPLSVVDHDGVRDLVVVEGILLSVWGQLINYAWVKY